MGSLLVYFKVSLSISLLICAVMLCEWVIQCEWLIQYEWDTWRLAYGVRGGYGVNESDGVKGITV